MTPKIQASLFALAQAAKRDMVPDEVSAHVEAITNEISAIKGDPKKIATSADIHGLLAMLPTSAPNLSGKGHDRALLNYAADRVKIIEEAADCVMSDAVRDLKTLLMFQITREHEVAALFKERALADERMATKLREIAHRK